MGKSIEKIKNMSLKKNVLAVTSYFQAIFGFAVTSVQRTLIKNSLYTVFPKDFSLGYFKQKGVREE